MPKVIIIGSGPAGISASLYCVRAKLETVIISNMKGALITADKIENYYGFPDGISAQDLQGNGIRQAQSLGVEVINDEVFSIGYNNDFTVECKKGTYSADGIIIATGSKRQVPKIKGIRDFEGKGISYCAICDAFFFKGKDVCVLGNGEYALHEANSLVPIVNSVAILTNGKKPTVEIPESINIIDKKISEITGEIKVEKIIFEDGSELATSGLFIAVGVAGSAALAKKIGAVVENGNIKTDENMKTSIKNIYAAGDCTGGLLQISKAVYEGAKAATDLIKSLRNNK